MYCVLIKSLKRLGLILINFSLACNNLEHLRSTPWDWAQIRWGKKIRGDYLTGSWSNSLQVIWPVKTKKNCSCPLGLGLGLGLMLELRFALWLGLELEFGFGLRLAFLKNLCDNNEHQKLAYNIGGKFEIHTVKQKTCRLHRDSQAAC